MQQQVCALGRPLHLCLHSLEEQGYFVRENRVVEGRVRKYYVITQQGRVALQAAKQTIAELVHEVWEEADDGRLPELAPTVDAEAEASCAQHDRSLRKEAL